MNDANVLAVTINVDTDFVFHDCFFLEFAGDNPVRFS